MLIFTHSEEMSETDYRFYKSSFDNLKYANMNVVIFAGQNKYDVCLRAAVPLTVPPRTSSIVSALHEGGACRISGAFQIHRDPLLMDYMGNMPYMSERYVADLFMIQPTTRFRLNWD